MSHNSVFSSCFNYDQLTSDSLHKFDTFISIWVRLATFFPNDNQLHVGELKPTHARLYL